MRFCLLWLALSCIVLAQTTTAPATKKPANETATAEYGALTGRVLGEDGPVPYASVSVVPAGDAGRGNIGKTVTADVEGNFKLDGLRALAWQVTASAPGYVTNDLDLTMPEAAPQPYHRIGDQVTLQLMKGGVITGRVLSAANEPLVAVRVSAQMVRDAAGRPATGGGGGQGGD
ncbi:MAG: carboxypeptidase regulatory-like domain-containing protein, partial [Verrucomicrobia bacterium]|nr:carboxypeptidase regulatory-like domain-containing protein [Verrucomicrobiota bacterium]